MITIYGTKQCGFCNKAVELAKKHKFKHEYKDVGYSKNYRELRSKNVDMRKIPHIWWGDKYIGSYGDFYQEVRRYLIMEEYRATS